jgi:transposase
MLFEVLVMTMEEVLHLSDLANQVVEFNTKLWRVFRHYVERAQTHLDDSAAQIWIDEIVRARGYRHVSVFVYLDIRIVLNITAGKDSLTVHTFATDLTTQGGDPAMVSEVCLYMSAAFIETVGRSLPQAVITYDVYYVIQLEGYAVDQARTIRRHLHRILQYAHSGLKNCVVESINSKIQLA